MKLQVFSVYDKAVAAFLPPFFSRAKGEAIRSFTTACNDQNHDFAKHLADFSLLHLGEWDDISGEFDCGPPSRVITALECVAEEPFREDNREATPLRRLPM